MDIRKWQNIVTELKSENIRHHFSSSFDSFPCLWVLVLESIPQLCIGKSQSIFDVHSGQPFRIGDDIALDRHAASQMNVFIVYKEAIGPFIIMNEMSRIQADAQPVELGNFLPDFFHDVSAGHPDGY